MKDGSGYDTANDHLFRSEDSQGRQPHVQVTASY